MSWSRGLTSAGLLSVLALPLAAQAQAVTGFYGAAGIGANHHEPVGGKASLSDVFGTPVGPGIDETSLKARTHLGEAGVISLGWGFGNGFRAEVEGSYRHNKVKDVRFRSFDNAGNNANQEQGKIRTWGLMANGFYDFKLGPVMPYLGAGVGYSHNKWHDVGGVNDFFTTDRLLISGKEGKSAYQLIAGAAFPIDAVRGLALTAEYRYFATFSGKFTGTYTLSGERVGDATVKADNDNHSVLIGLRYSFGD